MGDFAVGNERAITYVLVASFTPYRGNGSNLGASQGGSISRCPQPRTVQAKRFCVECERLCARISPLLVGHCTKFASDPSSQDSGCPHATPFGYHYIFSARLKKNLVSFLYHTSSFTRHHHAHVCYSGPTSALLHLIPQQCLRSYLESRRSRV